MARKSGLRGASKSGKGTGVPRVGVKISKSGVSGTNTATPVFPNYPSRSVGAPGRSK